MMKKFLKFASVMVMVLMLLAMTGCNKTDKDKIVDTTPVVEDDKEPKAVENNETKEENSTADVEAIDDETTLEAEELKPTEPAEEATSDQTTAVIEGGIKDVYAQYNIKAGTCLSDTMITQSKFTDIITANFNSITHENFMKPDYLISKSKSIETGELSVEFTKRTTDLLDWAKSNGMSMRGHVLVWHSQTPDWIFYNNFDKAQGLADRDTMLARMENYIKQTFELLDTLGYADMFYAYDVVNEAINDDGSYRDSYWKKTIGEDFIWYAFSYADKYAPETIKLYYNDYNEQFKTDYIVKLANSLVDETGRSLIDGIGCQGHLYTGDSIDDYMSTLTAFSETGLDVQITELDVSLGTWQNILKATEENLLAQGQYYYELVNRIIEGNAAGTTSVSGITYWGFADSLSWRYDRSPLLFDGKLEAKYAYHGARQDYDKAGY
ncbi:MAG TPA: endo-1,4-beta-xylanase [Mobilitalea sp.]|nr:endo-1,4-beta-xylanase [Mobilitalea sp.]